MYLDFLWKTNLKIHVLTFWAMIAGGKFIYFRGNIHFLCSSIVSFRNIITFKYFVPIVVCTRSKYKLVSSLSHPSEVNLDFICWSCTRFVRKLSRNSECIKFLGYVVYLDKQVERKGQPSLLIVTRKIVWYVFLHTSIDTSYLHRSYESASIPVASRCIADNFTSRKLRWPLKWPPCFCTTVSRT